MISTATKLSALAASAVMAAFLTGCAPAAETTTETTSSAATATVDRSDWPEKLVFGAVPSEESSSLVESYQKILDALESGLGIEVEFFQATDYAGIIEGQVAGNVDLLDITGNLRRDDRDIALDVSVFGRDHEAPEARGCPPKFTHTNGEIRPPDKKSMYFNGKSWVFPCITPPALSPAAESANGAKV